VIERSTTEGEIVADAVDELFPPFGSAVDAVTVAVFVSRPEGASGATATVNEKVAEAALVRVAIEQDNVPAAPAAGFVQVNAGPVVCVLETNVVFGGSVSFIVTLVASDGPLLLTTIV
jgi:hypothetical protein